jgi:RimJ/RimL family protein N-acetyltransferase
VLKAAGRVYDRNGFVEWGSYTDNLRADRFMALDLKQWRPRLTPARGVVSKL